MTGGFGQCNVQSAQLGGGGEEGVSGFGQGNVQPAQLRVRCGGGEGQWTVMQSGEGSGKGVRVLCLLTTCADSSSLCEMSLLVLPCRQKENIVMVQIHCVAGVALEAEANGETAPAASPQ